MSHVFETEIARLREENAALRIQLDNMFDEALRLRHTVERLHALSHMALRAGEGLGAREAEQETGIQVFD
jgi:hypothetical protein